MFAPAIPLGGYAGWRFLQRTKEVQQDAFVQSPLLQRDLAHFENKIGLITTAEELVDDRQLLKVALTAYGLEEDLDNKFFIKTILAEGTGRPEALANRLADKRYADLADAFAFDSPLPRTLLPSFTEEVTERYKAKSFQSAVGEVNGDMRLALNLGPAIDEIVAKGSSPKTEWLTVMGNTPLRRVFDKALGMPAAFGALDLDKQVAQYQKRSEQVFGIKSVSEFANPEKQEDLIRIYMVRNEMSDFASQNSRAQIALTLMSQISNPWSLRP